MKKIGKRLFLFSFIMAVIASGAIYLYLKSLDDDVKKVPKETIIIAAQDIQPRTIIKEDMIKEVEVESDSLFGSFLNKKEKIVGKYTKETIFKDERFHKDKLINELEEELSLKINGNNRAVTIMASNESGVCDLIKPGDRIDILAYLPEVKEAERIVRPDIEKLILQNIEVLAIDKNLYRDTEEREIPPSQRVTISVPVFDLEKLALAEDIGDLKLALRPLDGDYLHTTEGVIWQELLLDDFYKMKDLFPQYEVKPVVKSKVNSDEYDYEKYYYYTVKYGDTLRKISEKFYNDPEKYKLIQQANKIDDEDKINEGTGIKIPVIEESEVGQ